jgi:histidinol-phosphate aminotransferase
MWESRMIRSRRDFFRFSAGIAGAALPWPFEIFARGTPQASRVDQEYAPIRLYSNENAYGPSPKVMDAIRLAVVSSNRYPRLQYQDLIERIATAHRISADQILLGCGSTEILRMTASALLGRGKQVIHASPTFEAIEHYARAVDAEAISVPLAPAFAHDLNRMLDAATPSTTLVYVCNPNNPTASLTPRKELETFIAKLPRSIMVVIDEAYHHYVATSAMYASFVDRPLDDDRVIVARTFSKVYGLAGLRLGYAVAAPTKIEQLKKFAAQDNINAIATQAAFAALDDAEGVDNFIEHNANDRQEFFNQAMARALKPIDSHANFVMMDAFHPADEVIEHFRRNNILIGRHFPAMDTYIRVSLGRPEEMLAFWKTWDLLPFSKNIMHH